MTDFVYFYIAIFQSIMTLFEKLDVPIANCIAIAVDNASVNVGSNNSLKTRLTAANPSIYVSGCPCHIIHNAATHGSKTLQVSYRYKTD